jgi:hypothetical protein
MQGGGCLADPDKVPLEPEDTRRLPMLCETPAFSFSTSSEGMARPRVGGDPKKMLESPQVAPL